jgi:hypothetical protein
LDCFAFAVSIVDAKPWTFGSSTALDAGAASMMANATAIHARIFICEFSPIPVSSATMMANNHDTEQGTREIKNGAVGACPSRFQETGPAERMPQRDVAAAHLDWGQADELFDR